MSDINENLKIVLSGKLSYDDLIVEYQKIWTQHANTVNYLNQVITIYENELAELRNAYKKEAKPNKIRIFIDRFWATVATFLFDNEKTTLKDRLKMFFKSMWVWTKSGFKLEDSQVAFSRYEMCKACDEYRPQTDQCRLCGCLMKTKSKVSSASCPLGKW